MLIKKLRFSVPLILFLILLLLAGIFAITQEQETETDEDELFDDLDYLDLFSEEQPPDFEGPLYEWISPGPPRWFRSNAGGMALEEIPSRLAALRNKYALVMDYIAPEEVEPRLLPFYHRDYTAEIRVLYEHEPKSTVKELRRQWLFKDKRGVIRLNAVFKPIPDEVENETEIETEIDYEETETGEETAVIPAVIPAVLPVVLPDESITEGVTESTMTAAIPEMDDTVPDNELPPVAVETELGESVGFIEVFNEKAYITDDYWLFENGGEIHVAYFYIGNTLVRAETFRKTAAVEPAASAASAATAATAASAATAVSAANAAVADSADVVENAVTEAAEAEANPVTEVTEVADAEVNAVTETAANAVTKTATEAADSAGEYRLMYTDKFRYNRSFSLRHVERLYHTPAEAEPVRLLFPNRVLEAASNSNFLSDKLFVSSAFLENYTVKAGFRMAYDTDGRGRIVSQTMFDDNDEEVWVITNTWSGDRIVAARKIEGKDEKLTEYEYDGSGNRIIQRDINNGVLERLVYTEDKKETEELYLNGVVVLRAYWEDGRKIHEERVRQ